MLTKKGLGPVVATALLMVVAVAAVVGFQSWFSTYNSSLFTNAEVQSNAASDNPIEINRLIGDTLYIVNNNANNLTVDRVEIDKNNCPLTQDLTPGVNRVNVSSCLENTQSITPEVVVYTQEGVLSKSFYVDDVVGGSSIVSVVESNGSFQLLSNGVVTCSDASVGDSATLSGTTYTAVSNQNLSDKIESNDAPYYETACTSLVTDMNVADSLVGGVFYNANINPNISHWDTSSVVDMSGMFSFATSFNQSISNFDTSSVTNMSNMFDYASVFNQPVSNFDTSQVTGMSRMFFGASDFNQSLSNFDTSSVTNMYYMFGFTTNFNQPLSNFDTSQVTDMSSMFDGASSFNQPLDNFDTSQVTNMYSMFAYASSFNQSLNFDTSQVNNMGQFFREAVNFNQPISFNTSNVEFMADMFRDAISFNQSLNFDTSSVNNMDNMFNNASSFDQDLTGWCVTNIGSEPTDFALNSPLNTSGLKPNWGTCP